MDEPTVHLNDKRWEALQARDPDAVAYFARHLAAPCAQCEDYLLHARPEPDALDAMTDEALLSLAPAREPALDEVGYARLRRRMLPPRPRRWLAGAAGIAAAAALTLAVGLERWSGEAATGTSAGTLKGEVPLGLELLAAAQLPGGELFQVGPETPLPSAAVVLLRYHATEAAAAVLVREVAGQPPEVLGRFLLEPGTHDLREGAELAGVSLAGEEGPVSLALVARPGVTYPSPEETAAALAPSPRAGGTELTVTRIHLHVTTP